MIITPRPPRPERPPARRKGFGQLVINSKPWAYIHIDGRDTGKVTSFKPLRVPAGKHRIKLVNPALKLEKTLTIEVEADEVVKRFVPLK